MSGQRRRDVPLYVWISGAERDTIRQRMAEAGVSNMSAFVRKMALNGFVLNVDLVPVKELVSLLRRCSGNINQVAIHANTYGVFPEEIAGLQKDYAVLWAQTNEILKQLAVVTAL